MPDETDSVIIDTSNSLEASSRFSGEGMAPTMPTESDIEIINIERRTDFIRFSTANSVFSRPRPEISAALALDIEVLDRFHINHDTRS
jgi:hypothetical protein